MTTLFEYWRSSASYRVRIALNMLGLPYDHRSVDLLKGEQNSAANFARNRQGLVPTLVIDGFTLTQSMAIIEYLDETRGPMFLPTDPTGRARVRALAYAIAMEIAPVCNLSVRTYAQAASGKAILADDWQTHFMRQGLASFEKMLDHPVTGQFCHQDQPGMADLCLVPQIYNARRLGIDLAQYPKIGAIMDRLEIIPAIIAAHPDLNKPKG